MSPKSITTLTLATLLAACQQPQPAAPTVTDSVNANAIAAASPATSAPVAPAPQPAPAVPVGSGTPATPGALPDDQPSLAEGVINPKSAEGAGQVLQTYGALLEEKKFIRARQLWGSGGAASGLTEPQFVAAYAKYREIHADVGKPGLTEGAAGSIYIEVPFRLYGSLTSGGRFNLVGPVTLKRVNDVDGATPAQLRWHIVQSGLKPRP